MPERAHGIDISKWQVHFDASVNPDDIHFVVMRSGYGIMPDPIFEQLYESILPVPIRGAYHYFRSEWGWKEQADAFLKLVKDRDFQFYALDIESGDNERSAGFARDAKRWMDYVAEKTGKVIVLYTNPTIYKTWLKPFGDWMKEWPLWLAQYWFEPDRNKQPALPEGAPEWKLWQYSADGNNKGAEYGVGSRSIDLDVFNGTIEEMQKWLGIKGAARAKAAKDEPTYTDLARKLAPIVAPLVANMLRKDPQTGRPRPPAGVSFGIPGTPADPAIPDDLDLNRLAQKLAPLVAPLVEKRLAEPVGRPGGAVSFGIPGAGEEPAELPGVQAVTGIGPAYAQRLAENGIRNVKALAGLGPAELADLLDTSEERAGEFIAQAKKLAGGKE